MRRLCAVVLPALGCGLFAGGPPEAAPDASGGAPADVASEGRALSCTAPPGACAAAIPTGWLAMVLVARAETCPAGFASLDLVAEPVPQQGACACDCTIQQQPSCATGPIIFLYGNSMCNLSRGPYAMGDGKCVWLGFTASISPMHAVTKLGLTAGTCTSGEVPDPSKVAVKPLRRCAPPPSCVEDVCRGGLPPTLRSCVAHDGDVACPAGPFSQKAAVAGAGVSLGCAACSACSVGASCPSAGTFGFYADSGCTQLVASVAADNGCHSNATGTASYIKYDAPPQNVVCQPGTSSPTGASLLSPMTFCCRP